MTSRNQQHQRRPSPAQRTSTTFLIKNMVCARCIKVVHEELRLLGLDVRSISLGEAVVSGKISASITNSVKAMLQRNGFELIEDRRINTIEQIKLAVLKLVRSGLRDETRFRNYSESLAREIGQEYHTLSALFSSMESVTIEQYIILQRIELVKELLKYGELTLSEISYKVGYSSVQHLSNQFKKVTGLTPSQFKKMMANTRKPLDQVSPA